MTFEQVRQLNGQKDEKGYQRRMTLSLMVQQVGAIEYSKEGKQSQHIYAGDSAGEAQNIKVYSGKDGAVPTDVAGSWQTFSVGPNLFNGKMFYTGFWNKQTTAPLPQQAAYNAPQSTNAPNPVESTHNCSFALCYAKDLVVAGKLELSTVFSWAVLAKQFMDTGKEPVVPDEVDDYLAAARAAASEATPPTGDEIPF